MKKVFIIVAAVLFCLSFTFEEAGARAGFRSGRSSYGYKGSRTYAPPAKPSAPKTDQTQKTAEQEPQSAYQPQSQPRPQGAFGGFGRTLAGGLMGGMIGSFLFSSLGYGATGGGFGGVGLFDILLIGLGVFLLIRFLRPRKAANAEAGKAAPQPGPEQEPYQQTDAFLGDLKRADSAFDAEEFRKKASDVFVTVQAAWKKRDLEPVKKHITGDLFHGMANELEKAVAGGSVNHIEKVSVRDSGITEAWQEEGLDYVTVRFTVEASALSTDRDGRPAGEGPKPVEFSEYWTFVREVWLQDWKLTAIQQERA